MTLARKTDREQGCRAVFPCPNARGISGRRPGEGTISRRNFQRGQSFPQFLGRQLEELPEAQVGHPQAEQVVRRLTLAVTDPEPTKVPVQTFQVQQTLRHLPVTRLLHPSHAVDAFHQAARTPGAAEYRTDPTRSLTPLRTCLRQLDCADQGPSACRGGESPRLATQTFQVQQRRQDVRVQTQLCQPSLHLIQEREALPAKQQPPGLGPCRAAEVWQRRGDDRLGLNPVIEVAFGGEELERRLGLVPGRLGGRGLIAEPFGLIPEPVQRSAVTLTGLSLTTSPIEVLPGHVGTLQGTPGRAPTRPQRTPPFTERMEDVERVVEVGLAGCEPAGALESHPFPKPRAIVANHRLKRRESREFLSPCDPVTRLDQPTREPAEALGLDDHQDGSAAKKISSAVPCFTAGRAASSSTSSNGPARLPASRVARPRVGTLLGAALDPSTTRNSRRATLRLTPSAWATVANSCCLSGVISTARFSRPWRAWTSARCSASCR